VRGVAGSVSGMLRLGLYRPLGSPTSAPPGGSAATVVAGLPKPTEGEPIPAAHEGGVTTPDNSIYTVWTSPSEHHLVFVHAGDAQRYQELHRRMNELADNFPHRGGSRSLANRLNQSSRWFPPPIVWLVLAIVAFAWRRVRGAPALWAPTIAGLLVVVLTALGLPADTHYSVPVAPAFVMLAGAALFAPRRELAPVASWRLAARDLRPVLGVAAGVIAAVWALRHYVTQVDAFRGSSVAPHDLEVFLRAAGHVVHGASPFGYNADQTYAYPPLLAFLVSPIHPLSAAAATLLWTIVSLGAIVGALWLLGLRDWRCYALAAVFEFTRSAVDLGTVAPLLLLAVAVAWRWRDRIAAPAAAVGVAIALKLFLWPLALWLALTGRVRAAGAAVLATVLLVLVPWAAIGFAGIGSYTGLLRHLSRDEASSSYSIVALSVRAHLPESVGVVLSLLVAAALLIGGGVAARALNVQGRQRDVGLLTIALAAALAASPIVWVHYFLLLLVPLALTEPRLSLLWLVPFAYEPLGEAAWPAGDARKLGLALVSTLVILGGSLYRTLSRGSQPVSGLALEPRAAPLSMRPRSETRVG
jgi:Glycosyltransferase family 87